MAQIPGSMPLGWKGDWLVFYVPGFVKMLRADSEGVWFEFRIADGLLAKMQAGTGIGGPGGQVTEQDRKAFYAGSGETLYVRRVPVGTTPAQGEVNLGTVEGFSYHHWTPPPSQKTGLPVMDPNQEGYGVVTDGKINPMGMAPGKSGRRTTSKS